MICYIEAVLGGGGGGGVGEGNISCRLDSISLCFGVVFLLWFFYYLFFLYLIFYFLNVF